MLDAETLPEDGPLLQLAREGIEQLNAKYPGTNGDTFFLFHRPRRWNPQEAVWMGYERKRGKLADLNALLRGGVKRSLLARGRRDRCALRSVKYVITLDTDTQLPRDAARQFIGAMDAPAESRALRRSTSGSSSKATASCSRAWPRACRARTARAMRACAARSRASIRTRAPSRMSIRTCFAKARSSARASTMSMRSNGP